MDDYDDEPPPPVPTFSEGSTTGRRGANSRAAASRASALKSAISIASKASAIISSSSQHASSSSIKLSNNPSNTNRERSTLSKVPYKPPLQPRPILIPTPEIKPPTFEPKINTLLKTIPIQQPRYVPGINKLPQQQSSILASINKYIHEPLSYNTVQPPLDIPVKPQVFGAMASILNYRNQPPVNLPNNYGATIQKARSRKQDMLALIELPVKLPVKKYKSVNFIKHFTSIEDIPVNQSLLEQLSSSLLRVVNSANKSDILNEFDNYQINLRISNEEPIHKKAFEEALINKRVYLTSDT